MAASVKDVATAAGVSVGTVSNVLNRPERVGPEIVARVQRAIAELGFVRNDAARQLRAGRSRSIGFVVPDSGNPFFVDVARGAEQRAAVADIALLTGNSDQDEQRAAAYLALFSEQRVNGLLFTPVRADGAIPPDLRVPVVLVDAEDPDGVLPSVTVDDVEGGMLAVAHLLAQGRRRIAFVCGPLQMRQVSDRLEGARRALSATPDATLEVIEMAALTVSLGQQAGESIAARPISERPDAVFCANDLLAIGVLQGASILGGLAVPDDLALVGYDDIDFARATVVPLSSVRQPAREIGAAAVELLFELLGAPSSPARHVRFRPELIVRASSTTAGAAESG